MTTLEQDIITEAVRLKESGLAVDHAYSWAKRWHSREYGWVEDKAAYMTFIRSLCDALEY